MNGIYVSFVIFFVLSVVFTIVPEKVFTALLSKKAKVTAKDDELVQAHLALLRQQEEDAVKELERRPDIWV